MGAIRSSLYMCVLVCALLASACEPAGPDVSFEQTEFLVLEGKYDEAIPALKEFLLVHPDHSGAHYYLGRAYAAAHESFWLTLAAGEIETALALYQRQGRKSAIERYSDKYFELTCHYELIRVRMKQVTFLMGIGAPRDTIVLHLQKAEEQLSQARLIDPESKDIQNLTEGINAYRKALGLPPIGEKEDVPKDTLKV